MFHQSILIQNGYIINGDKQFFGDVYLRDGKIEEISNSIDRSAEKVIDASGKLVFAGFIDPHVHLHLPTPAGYSVDDFDTGTKAALYGGTTAIADFVTPYKGQSLVEAYIQRVNEARNSHIAVRFHVSPIEWTSQTAAELTELVENYNVRTFKIYTAYKNSIGINDDVIVKVLELAAKLDVTVLVHAENNEIIDFLRQKFIAEGKTSPFYHPLSRPADVEIEAVSRILLYAKYTNAKVYFVHISTREAVEMIQSYKIQNHKVFVETCPQYLVFVDDCYEGDFYETAKYVFSPPLRKFDDKQALWEAIDRGLIDVVATDHCPFNLYGQKDLGIDDFTKIPNGTTGLEYRIKALYTYGCVASKISLSTIARICSEKPSEILGFENKGFLKAGYDADVVVFDPNKKFIASAKNQVSRADNTIYEGKELIGNFDYVIVSRGNQMQCYEFADGMIFKMH